MLLAHGKPLRLPHSQRPHECGGTRRQRVIGIVRVMKDWTAHTTPTKGIANVWASDFVELSEDGARIWTYLRSK